MIIAGAARGDIDHWASYLPNPGENEKVQQIEIRGTVAPDLRGALEEMQALSRCTGSEGNFLYHAHFDPHRDDHLTREQFLYAVDLLEKRLGFEEHQRIIYEHVKDGRQHYHVLWNRTDPKTMTIRDIQGDWHTCRRVANEIEEKFDLVRTKPVRDYNDPRPYKEYELAQAKKTGIDPKAVTRELSDLWLSTTSGTELKQAIEEHGYILAKGEKAPFVIIDQAGKDHSLARRLDGVNTAALRERMKDIDRESLPNVTEAKAAQRERLAERRRAQEPARERLQAVADEITGPRPYKEYELAQAKKTGIDPKAVTRELSELWRTTTTGAELKQAIEEHGYILAKGEKAPFVIIDHAGKDHSLARRLDGVNTAALRERMQDINRDSLPSVAEAKATQRDSAKTTRMIAVLLRSGPEAGEFVQELDDKKLILARATAPDIAQLEKDIHRRNLDADTKWRHTAAHDENAPRPRAWTMPRLKADELVIVDQWGNAHKLNPKHLDLATLESKARAGEQEGIPTLGEAREHMKFKRDAREEYRQTFWKERAERQAQAAERAAAWHTEHAPFADGARQAGKGSPSLKHMAGRTAGCAIGVAGKAGDALLALGDFVLSIFDSTPPKAATNSFEQMRIDARRDAALERMEKSLKRDNTVRGEDIVALHTRDITKIRDMGDPALVQMIEEHKRQRERERSYGRER